MNLVRTPSQTVGPYYAIGLCRRAEDELAPDGIELSGCLIDGKGDPIEDGLIELFEPVSRAWGRSGTDGHGRFRLLVPREVAHLECCVFARGLLRHQLTRIYLRETDDVALSALSEAERRTVVAHFDGTGLRFDIRMQGEHATVFFDH
jgi:protocatechuate 3,4-dioxygenase alpha subunit